MGAQNPDLVRRRVQLAVGRPLHGCRDSSLHRLSRNGVPVLCAISTSATRSLGLCAITPAAPADAVCLGRLARGTTASDGAWCRTVPFASLPGPTPLRYMGRQVTPGYAEKPRSKVRIRRIRCVSMSARCRQSRADTVG